MANVQSVTIEFANGSAAEASPLVARFHEKRISDEIAAELVLDVARLEGVAETVIVETEQFPPLHVDLPQPEFVAGSTDKMDVSFSTKVPWVSTGPPSAPPGTAYVCLECGHTQSVEGAFRTRTALWCRGQCDGMQQFERKDREHSTDE